MVISLIAFALVSVPESEPVNHTIAPVGGGDYLVYGIKDSDHGLLLVDKIMVHICNQNG